MSSANAYAPPDTGSIRFKRLRLGVLVFGPLIILAFVCSSAYDAWRSYHYSLATTDREIANMANALAEQTAWTFQAVDLMLLDTARWYRSDSGRIPPEHINAVLQDRTGSVQQVRQVMIVDAQGNQRYGSRGSAPPGHNVSDRSYFIAQRDGTAAGLFMSEPLVTRSEGHGAVILSRRIDDEKGGFGGVVTAVVDLSDLGQYYRAVKLGTGSAIQLVRNDETLLARNPPIPDAVGQKFPALVTAPTTPAPLFVDPIDGQKEFIAVAPLRNAPVTIAVTRDEAIALRPWRDETIRTGVRTLIITLLGAFTIAVLLRQLRRLAAGERALRESEERYALAMEAANEGHWDWIAATDRLFLSPKMKTLYGFSTDAEINSRSAWLARIDTASR